VSTRRPPSSESSGRTRRAAQTLAGRLDQHYRMLVSSGGVEQRFQDAGQVANRNLLAQKLLQHFLHFSEAEYLGNQFFDQLGWLSLSRSSRRLVSCRVSNS